MSALPVDPHLYSTFLGVMVVMAITPGPANLFAVATGVMGWTPPDGIYVPE